MAADQGIVAVTNGVGSHALRATEGRLSISLRKPFGIGFHVDTAGGDSAARVVDVKGAAARAAGVKVTASSSSNHKYFVTLVES